MAINKRNIEEEIKRKKSRMMNNLDKVVRNPNLISPEKIKKFFPENHDLLEKFKFLNSASDVKSHHVEANKHHI